MSCNLNLDVLVECVKHIVDYNRCSVCDKLDGPRLSYPCGHTACKDCTNCASNCLFCLTPLDASKGLEPVHSNIETRRARSASELLKSCQNTFNVDVNKRSRLSKQQQIERDLFPHCIQAPSKYTNKRKSGIDNLSDKENQISVLPGELTSPSKAIKMEKTNYIHQWLDKHDTVIKNKQIRQPFGDLNPNQQTFKRSTLKRRADFILDKAINDENENIPPKIKRKQSYKKLDTKTNLKTYMKPVEKATFSSFLIEDENKGVGAKKHEKDESGIEVDMEPVVIENSQHEVIDKDRLALLAVLEANKNEPSNDILQCNEVVNYTDDVEKSLISITKPTDKPIKVPFYKKSNLTAKSSHCATKTNDKKSVKSKDVSITIETKELITTINVNQNENMFLNGNKKSVGVQTDILGMTNERNDKSTEMDMKVINNINPDSEDLFTNDVNDISKAEIDMKVKETENVEVISDSDEEVNQSGVIQVSAEVHRSSDQMDYGVLTEMNDAAVSTRALARPSRGLSPGSTDSSEKENYDPNRLKRSHHKNKLQKKRQYMCK